MQAVHEVLRRRLCIALCGAATVIVCACKPASQDTANSDSQDYFECRERRAEFMVVGGFVAEEAGVSVTCIGGPMLTKWRLEGTERIETPKAISTGEFEALWRKIDSTGWRNVADECDNPGAAPDDPIYSIGIADRSVTKNLTCAGKTLPFPYDRLVNELERPAAAL